MLSFGSTLCAAQRAARPKSSHPFYEKLYTYVSPRVSACVVPSYNCTMMQWKVQPSAHVLTNHMCCDYFIG